MNLTHSTRYRRAFMAVMSGTVLWLMGCSRSVTGPETISSSSGAEGTARVVTASELNIAPAEVSVDVADLVRDQPGVEARLRQVAPGLVGTAISLHGNRPVLLALTDRAMGRLPARVGGRDIEEFVVGDVRAQTYYCGTSTGRTDECAAGTLGAIVTDGLRNYWLSNWHVFIDRQGKVGDPIVSPGRYDVACGASTTVGAVSRFVPIRFDGSYNRVDCAIAAITPGKSVSAIEAGGANSFLPSATIQTATVGLLVKKIGKKTGYTTGKVIAINGTTTTNYGFGYARFSGVVFFTPMSDNGDSGSLICTQSGNRPVALLFAGNNNVSVGCPIAEVFQAIGAHVAN